MTWAGTWRWAAIIVATQRPAGGVRGHVKRWADALPQQKVFKCFKPALNGAQHRAASAQPGQAAAVRTPLRFQHPSPIRTRTNRPSDVCDQYRIT